MSNLGKLFTSILTNRVDLWIKNKSRRRSSTLDANFVLHNLIENFLDDTMRIPCAFFHLKNAFDSVYRNAQWYELYKMGLDGKILRIFKEMYLTVKSCIKYLNSF